VWRPALETVSWIAGIASALIAAYLLFAPARQQPPQREPEKTAEDRQPPDKIPQISSARPEDIDTTNFRAALETAKSIRSSATRDSELRGLAREAISRGQLELAFEAANEIRDTTTRDEVLAALTCWAAHARTPAFARAVANAIRTSTVRDDALKQIVSVASIKRGRGENDVSCPRL